MKYLNLSLCLLIFLAPMGHATDWTRQAELPEGKPRTNILGLSATQWAPSIERGTKSAFHYPVTVSELLVPYEAFMNFFQNDSGAIRNWIFRMARTTIPFKTELEVMDWLGIHPFPKDVSEQGPGVWPEVTVEERELGMGATVMESQGAKGLTFSCAACHSSELFGKKVVGLTNRFPRANEFFLQGQKLLPLANPTMFAAMTGATRAEVELLKRSRYAVQFVGAKQPQVLGLDTSLAQVALSLAKRGTDPYAERKSITARPHPLSTQVADSKPAVWWNVKYKTRWLSDGSIVEGNPILTNFLWNEIGRGVDLHELEKWMQKNNQVIDDLTSAVFATKAPEYLDFLPAETFNYELARAGEKHFKNNCMGCHGQYEKAWDQPGSENLPLKELVRTVNVWYHKKTPVIDVGTDPGRYKGMGTFSKELNNLAISKTIKTVVEPQQGYVPPPLVGIWSRWPYFHNNSAPNLCAVLTKSSARPVTYWSGAAVDPKVDYDSDCAGYPLGDKVPAAWKEKPEHSFNTKMEGLGNSGHDEGIFLENGRELMTSQEKRALIEFLKTL